MSPAPSSLPPTPSPNPPARPPTKPPPPAEKTRRTRKNQWHYRPARDFALQLPRATKFQEVSLQPNRRTCGEMTLCMLCGDLYEMHAHQKYLWRCLIDTQKEKHVHCGCFHWYMEWKIFSIDVRHSIARVPVWPALQSDFATDMQICRTLNDIHSGVPLAFFQTNWKLHFRSWPLMCLNDCGHCSSIKRNQTLVKSAKGAWEDALYRSTQVRRLLSRTSGTWSRLNEYPLHKKMNRKKSQPFLVLKFKVSCFCFTKSKRCYNNSVFRFHIWCEPFEVAMHGHPNLRLCELLAGWFNGELSETSTLLLKFFANAKPTWLRQNSQLQDKSPIEIAETFFQGKKCIQFDKNHWPMFRTKNRVYPRPNLTRGNNLCKY